MRWVSTKRLKRTRHAFASEPAAAKLNFFSSSSSTSRALSFNWWKSITNTHPHAQTRGGKTAGKGVSFSRLHGKGTRRGDGLIRHDIFSTHIHTKEGNLIS